ncbi:hypothetical protein H0H92_008290 [Tricholoma furcatifolium]|nr:hypothetical protein H0H92_008290 [Tricholoma furcatifolium]
MNLLHRPKKWVKAQTPDDPEFEVKDARVTDLLILVMGATGAGKSTFVNLLPIDEPKASVGGGPESHTQFVRAYHLPDSEFPGNRIFLVDTPGFADSNLTASEIVRRISVWLAKSYTSDMKVAGVIYCHSILEPRWSSSTQENFELFKTLCGPSAARKTVIVTTKWDVPRDVESFKDSQRKFKETCWKDIIHQGADVHRSMNTEKDARDTIDCLLYKNAYYDPLQIQKELVDRNLSLYKTGVANTLFLQVLERLKIYKERAAALREKGGNPDELSRVEREIKELTNQLKSQAVTIPRKLLLLVAAFL